MVNHFGMHHRDKPQKILRIEQEMLTSISGECLNILTNAVKMQIQELHIISICKHSLVYISIFSIMRKWVRECHLVFLAQCPYEEWVRECRLVFLAQCPYAECHLVFLSQCPYAESHLSGISTIFKNYLQYLEAQCEQGQLKHCQAVKHEDSSAGCQS